MAKFKPGDLVYMRNGRSAFDGEQYLGFSLKKDDVLLVLSSKPSEPCWVAHFGELEYRCLFGQVFCDVGELFLRK